MKKTILTFLGVIAVILTLAQPPQAFKYQAVVRDAAGEIMSNQALDIRISIHNETPVGAIIYQEIFSGTTNQFGLISLNIGLGSPIIGAFSNISWFADSKFIEVEINLDGGADYYSLGTSELFSVPYSLYSDRSSDSYWGLYNSSVYYNSGNVGIGTSNPLDKLHVADHIRVGEDPSYPTVYGELIHEGGGTGFIINAQAGGGGWADLYFQTNGTTKMFIESAGNVGIGTTTLASGYKLSVDGKVACEEVFVEYSGNWPDYVFSPEYNLLNLTELEDHIIKNNHLPGIPSAEEIEESGFHLAEMQKLVLQKIEELTLYTIDQGKLIKDLQNEVNLLKKENTELKRTIQLK